jgi:DNA mismatch repair ATPase MutS
MSHSINVYKEKLKLHTSELKAVRKRGTTIAIIRGAIFLTALILCIIFRNYGLAVVSSIVIVSLVPFVYCIKLSLTISKQIRRLKGLVTINRNELNASQGNLSAYENGIEFSNPEHPYCLDLDMFGNKSVFQNINRTCTNFGKKLLAGWLCNPVKKKQKIELRQDAVKELSLLNDWRQEFHVWKYMINTEKTSAVANNQSDDEKGDLKQWLEEEAKFAENKIFRLMLIALPVIAVLLFVSYLADLIPVSFFISYLIFQLTITGWNIRKINAVHNKVTKKNAILNKYRNLILLIEKEKFDAELLINLQKRLQKDDQKASQHLIGLTKLVSALDNRLNMLFSVAANALVLWDLQCIVRLELWKRKFRNDLPIWLYTIGRFDALNSLACFSFNNPEFCFPVICDEDFTLDMQNLGHFFIDRKQRVNNNFTINKHGFFVIITGANMAGKSTFLRTVGVNLILAMIGAPVCATAFRFTPVDVFTSVQMRDSLQKNESYFYAELKRLKSIIDRLKTTEPLFVIVDEMLKGTNSKDKHFGSEQFIRRLIDLKAVGIIATHDIALGELADELPGNIKNQRFEVEIINDKLYFDYKLQEGISQNLNATFLMKQMDIINTNLT